MTKTLEEIAAQLRDANKKVQLIYAFNGTGKTRLSRAMKNLIAPRIEGDDTPARNKILYYSAFTEDLFYWDNDLKGDGAAKLVIQPNSFTDWILVDQGQEVNITRVFQHYSKAALTPTFNQAYTRDNADGSKSEVKAFSEVTFTIEAGDDAKTDAFKISKGEESNFIWSVFYTLLETVVAELSIAEPDQRGTDQFNALEYVFVDDPVSSLDENHLIELAVNLAELVKKAPAQLRFVITTHSPLFYNVLHNELDLKKKPANDGCYLLERHADGSFTLNTKYGDANKSFTYHLHLRRMLEEAIAQDKVERYHFTLLRNLYEKTAGFLGHDKWGDLLNTAEGNKEAYVRLINTFSHSSLSTEQVADPTPQQKQTVKFLLDNLINNYGYWKQEAQNG
ncbi:AAA family ATPase [Frigidibacter albus]|uniref:AAA family ATPase n=1 Tax=Frigidibacter albus TaxID=1465486 RepID=A0A6L8VLX6_9RHOB|nr:AAA family ATPase [Frigidibacter albus]MZQ91223.1 AAA family ATPase [Frigidibacter albus]NBE33150.1 AAA family ATPase [Frigidibacter albus]GGH63472.1 anticodon nuclease [Frigidibacter albus]